MYTHRDPSYQSTGKLEINQVPKSNLRKYLGMSPSGKI